MLIKSVQAGSKYSPFSLLASELYVGDMCDDLHELIVRAVYYEQTTIDVWLWYCTLCLKLGEVDEAYRSAEMACDINPRVSQGFTLMAHVLERQKNSGFAEQLWRKAVHLDPQSIGNCSSLDRSLKNRAYPDSYIIKAVYKRFNTPETLGTDRVTDDYREASTVNTLPVSGLCHTAAGGKSGYLSSMFESHLMVIIPVYDDFACVRLCLDSVFDSQKSCSTPFDILVINDASPDDDLCQWLRGLSDKQRILLLENKENVGFIGTANRGLQMCSGHDVVLLNADTFVSGDWVDRLRNTAYRDPSIASVCPFSNNAQLLSSPCSQQVNELDLAKSVVNLDNIFSNVNHTCYVEIPTGIGFCMYLKREALNVVGFFDDIHMERGYGEDVDLCQRFIENGWINVCATDVFVGHSGGRSFQNEKNFRVTQNDKVLKRRYPTYHDQYRGFLKRDPLHKYRQAVEELLIETPRVESTALIVCGDDYTQEEYSSLRFRQAQVNKATLWLYRKWQGRHSGRKWLHLSEDGMPGLANLVYRWPDDKVRLEKHLQNLNISNILVDFERYEFDAQLLDVLHAFSAPVGAVSLPESYVHYPVGKLNSNLAVVAIMQPVYGQLFGHVLAMARHIRRNKLALCFWLMPDVMDRKALLATGCVRFAARSHIIPGGWSERLAAAGVSMVLSKKNGVFRKVFAPNLTVEERIGRLQKAVKSHSPSVKENEYA